jgi:hypothetical protein
MGLTMSKLLNLSQYRERRIKEGDEGALYNDALDVLDMLLQMTEGDVTLVWIIDGEMFSRDMSASKRFQINLEDLGD